MKDNREKWIDDIRNRIEDYSEPLPVGLWEKIEADIPSAKVIPLWRRWQSVAAAAVAVVGVSTLSLWYWSSDKYVNQANNAEILNVVKPATVIDAQPLMSDNIENEVSDGGNRLAYNATEVTTDSRTIDFAPVNDVILMNTVAEEEMSENNYAVTEVDDDHSKEKRINMMKADRETAKRNAAYLAMSVEKDNKDSKIQVGVMTGNIPYSSSNSFSGMSRLSTLKKVNSNPNNAVAGEISDATASYTQVLFNNIGKETYTDVKHHIPVTVGASLKWNLNDKWAVETGLNYTYLYSELKSGAQSYIEDRQKLHYVGIPLKVHRTIWDNSTFNFYASFGGMIEKCLSGTVETVYAEEGNVKSSENEKIDEKPLQFSALASVGIQANFNKWLSIYFEPGMAYYFDDNTELLTIRKDKPFNFNMQLGLRFNLGK